MSDDTDYDLVDDPPDCAACNTGYALSTDHEASNHGLCWPCASAALDESMVRIAQLEWENAELRRVTKYITPRRRFASAQLDSKLR